MLAIKGGWDQSKALKGEQKSQSRTTITVQECDRCGLDAQRLGKTKEDSQARARDWSKADNAEQSRAKPSEDEWELTLMTATKSDGVRAALVSIHGSITRFGLTGPSPRAYVDITSQS